MIKAFLVCYQLANVKGLSDGLESQRHSIELLGDTYQRCNENPCWLTTLWEPTMKRQPVAVCFQHLTLVGVVL